ncbi:hypothetical protein ACIRON_16505 [Nocardioides sp. NPDC101246]|uniref:hypothetical protein n=1 Tax=Nocardioides sp. NPDC101246 TaxID=3364336 RepID=UPI003810703E
MATDDVDAAKAELRPDWLRIDLSVSLRSQSHEQSDDLGWERWYARIFAGWDVYDDPDRGAKIAASLDRIFPPASGRADLGECTDELEVEVGGCELMLLRFDLPHPVFGKDVRVPSTGLSIFEAADALSQDLADLVGPIVDLEGESPFVDQVMDAAEDGWYDDLLIVRSVGIDKHFRGMGIGGWAVARVVNRLAAATTLVALTAAPLNRSEFLRELGAAPDSHADLTPEHSLAWDAACGRIAANWQLHLGVEALHGHPHTLFTAGGDSVALTATLASWSG